MLHRIWLGFFLLAFAGGLYQWLIGADAAVFQRMVQATFDMSKLSVELALGLIGTLAFWLGIMKLAEAAGLITKLANGLSPLFTRLMPDVPKGDPAIGSMTMNLSANMLGLDNAATPLGLKAMQDLQRLNPDKTRATDAQILFLVLNTSSVTLFPITVFLYRAQQGASDPTSVFIPILMATCCSTLAGLLAVAWVQKIRLWERITLLYLGGFFALLLAFIGYFATLTVTQLQQQSSLIGNLMIFSAIICFLTAAHLKGVNIYETFVEGAKEGFSVAIMIIPYLLAMLVAIGVFRASGVMDGAIWLLREGISYLGIDTRFVDALPTALMKPLSGSGARAMMLDTINTHGVDSFAGRLAAIIQGSTETTFYVLAVYFGSVGIRHTRHALACGLTADLAGIISAIVVGYWFFG
ncbi:nucleoside recognition domain-containing protein [Amphritea sp. 1_MG-2023]|uniref:nucleoside recognition domain-containing protein n=1 Tax=Amphritea sp. 1_MG-2023 TaxID=3062670 RepID=UPI0026E3895F|nr:spore maturation protein [Amphritea sp. 1_MG-2023]MDO6562439.1 nucleoside recognition domain-containing protein [Amphritea sp. 1_MG-2023]